MSKKIDRATHGPSWTEVILGAALSLGLGVALGAILLVLRPVVEPKEMPKAEEIDPRAVYFVAGSRDPGKARQALLKRKAFVEGQSVTITEDELNALASPNAASAAPDLAEKAKADSKAKGDPKGKEAEKAAPPAAASGALAAGVANFRIRDGELQVGVPVRINALDLGLKVVAQARGGFVNRGDMFVFNPTTLYLGSLPVQRLPFLAEYVRNQFLSSQPIPEDIKTSWMKVANVAIDGSAIKLTMP